MQCTNCGHQNAPGSSFCLNCGTRLQQPDPGGTQQGAGGLPAAPTVSPVPAAGKASPLPPIGSAPTTPLSSGGNCVKCGATNAPNMRFCRQCGTPLSGAPQTVSGSGPQAPRPTPVPGPSLPVPLAPAQPAPSVPMPGYASGQGSGQVRNRPATPTPPPGAVPPGSSQPQRAPTGGNAAGMVQCGSCGGQTPGGFSFCQRCGKPLNAPPPTQAQSPVPPPGAQSRTPTPKSVRIPVATEPPWALLISVNRDGSDGAVHELCGDFVELGNSASVGLRFDDPYLAGCHARIERVGTGGARIVPIDRLNGVFRRLRQDTPLEDGAVILIGRELLRFNVLKASESKPSQLSQHGVSLFGCPMREAWGRLSEILPSGGIRDVRHLFGKEMVIGREEGELVFGEDEFLSRRHAAFRWEHGHCVLSDLGSSNGTFLRLTEPANLSDGDFLRIGDQMFRYKPNA